MFYRALIFLTLISLLGPLNSKEDFLLVDILEQNIEIDLDFNKKKIIIFGKVRNDENIVITLSGDKSSKVVERVYPILGLWVGKKKIVVNDIEDIFFIYSSIKFDKENIFSVYGHSNYDHFLIDVINKFVIFMENESYLNNKDALNNLFNNTHNISTHNKPRDLPRNILYATPNYQLDNTNFKLFGNYIGGLRGGNNVAIKQQEGDNRFLASLMYNFKKEFYKAELEDYISNKHSDFFFKKYIDIPNGLPIGIYLIKVFILGKDNFPKSLHIIPVEIKSVGYVAKIIDISQNHKYINLLIFFAISTIVGFVFYLLIVRR